MVGVFACPECGHELELEGLSPGREVLCGGCSTWVEVPFLPRAAGWKRGFRPRRRRAWESKALRGAAVFAAVVLLALAAFRAIGGRARSDREHVLAELVASADRAEQAGDVGVALREIEGAVAVARAADPRGSARLDGLLGRRDRASIREAGSRLAGVDALDPDRAVGEALTLADRARCDRALAPMAGAIAAKVESAARRQAEADLDSARRALGSGRDAEAFAAAGRLHDRADRLAEADARRFRAEAREVIAAAVARSGVIIPPVTGRFVAGSIDAYSAALGPLWSRALLDRGYLPQPRSSPWRPAWDEGAPFRAVARIVESQEEFYLQSKNRTTRVDATLELTHADRPAWQVRLIGRTRSPQPGLSGYVAGHLATASRRDPEVERQFHDDAQDRLLELAARSIRGLPDRERAARAP